MLSPVSSRSPSGVVSDVVIVSFHISIFLLTTYQVYSSFQASPAIVVEYGRLLPAVFHRLFARVYRRYIDVFTLFPYLFRRLQRDCPGGPTR